MFGSRIDPPEPPPFDHCVAVIPCNVRRFAVCVGARCAAFDPQRASIAIHGAAPTVNDGPTAALLIAAVSDVGRVVRAAFGVGDGSTLVTQRGVFSRGDATTEGVRAIFFQAPEEDAGSFRARAIATAERVLRELALDEVIVELQVRGVSTEVLGIVP